MHSRNICINIQIFDNHRIDDEYRMVRSPCYSRGFDPYPSSSTLRSRRMCYLTKFKVSSWCVCIWMRGDRKGCSTCWPCLLRSASSGRRLTVVHNSFIYIHTFIHTCKIICFVPNRVVMTQHIWKLTRYHICLHVFFCKCIHRSPTTYFVRIENVCAYVT